MRVVSLLLCVLLACCMAFAMAQGDAAPATPAAVVPEQQQQQQAAQVPTPAEPVAAVQQQEVPAAAAPVVPETPATPTPAAPVDTPAAAATPAAPASSDSAAVEAVQRSVSELASQSRSTSEKVDKLSQIVSEGFTKLHAADAAQNAAAGSAKSASADATASALKDSSARVGQLEKEVKELKSILQNFVAEQGKLNAAAAAEAKKSAAKPAAGADQSAILSDIRSSQKEILSLLNTTAWNFDHEALLETAKTRGLEASSALGRLVGQAVEQAQTHYPTLQQSAIELGTSLGSQGMEHAEVLRGHAEQGATVAHSALSQLLKEQGVPAEYIKPAVLSLLSIAVLVNALIIFSLLKCLCRACCCCNCGNKKPRAAHAAGAAAGGAASAYKKNKNKKNGSEAAAADSDIAAE